MEPFASTSARNECRRRVEAPRVIALIADVADDFVGEIRCGVNHVGDVAFIAHAHVMQAVTCVAAAGVLGVMQGRSVGVQVEFAVVDGAANEEGSHGGSPAVTNFIMPAAMLPPRQPRSPGRGLDIAARGSAA